MGMLSGKEIERQRGLGRLVIDRWEDATGIVRRRWLSIFHAGKS